MSIAQLVLESADGALRVLSAHRSATHASRPSGRS